MMGLLSDSNSWVHHIIVSMSRDQSDSAFLLTAACTVLVAWLMSTLYWLLWKPDSRRRFYAKQGIRGPVFRPFIGNLPEVRELRAGVPKFGGQISESPARRVGIELFVFSEKYGKVSIFEQGSMTRIILADPKLAKEVLLTKAVYYHKSALSRESISTIAGAGSIVTAEGGNWKQKNHIMSPAFRHTFLKGLFHHIVESGNDLVTKWEKAINNAADIKQGAEVAVHLDVPQTLLDIIIRTTFGSVAVEGGDIYAVHDAISFFPTPTNTKMWMEKRTMEKVLKNIVSARLKLVNDLKTSTANAARYSVYGSDLLGMMLEAMDAPNSTMTASQLLDECKLMFLATDSPSSLLLIWSLTLLAQHPEWQQRVRSEVQEVLGEATPQPDNLCNLKLMDMVLNETLRLYPPVGAITRDAVAAHQVGSLTIAAGTDVVIPISILHQSEEIWGQDAHLFKPDRWDTKNHKNGKSSNDINDAAAAAASDGVNFNSFMPFGGGNRICLGRNLVRMAVKLLLSELLRRFSFSVAPSYCHAPGGDGATLWPKYGLQLMIKNVDSKTTTN